MDHVQAGHPGIAAVSLLAAALGVLSGAIDPAHHGLVAAMTPDDVTAWTKAITGAVFTAVNTLVGCWHLVRMGRSVQRRRKPRPKAPAVHPSDGPAA